MRIRNLELAVTIVSAREERESLVDEQQAALKLLSFMKSVVSWVYFPCSK